MAIAPDRMLLEPAKHGCVPLLGVTAKAVAAKQVIRVGLRCLPGRASIAALSRREHRGAARAQAVQAMLTSGGWRKVW